MAVTNLVSSPARLNASSTARTFALPNGCVSKTILLYRFATKNLAISARVKVNRFELICKLLPGAIGALGVFGFAHLRSLFEEIRQCTGVAGLAHQRLPAASFGQAAIASDDARDAEMTRFHGRETKIFIRVWWNHDPARAFHVQRLGCFIDKPSSTNAVNSASFDL